MIDPNLITTIRVGELPLVPFLLTDKIPHEVGTDLKSGTIQQLLDFLRPLVGKMQYECVDLVVDSQYIQDNFVTDNVPTKGLGTNLCLGFAIRNGNNGTDNIDGRCEIGYGDTFNSVGAIGGDPNTTLVQHSHYNGVANEIASAFVYGGTTAEMPGTATFTVAEDGGARTYQGNTNDVGTTGVNKNYQPYKVVLKIMKL
jgi:hypothetical protein